jgi:hypothetical protein
METDLIKRDEIELQSYKSYNISDRKDFRDGFSSGVDFAIEKLEVKKLKQEHAEMVEFLEKQFEFLIYCRDNMKVSRPVFNQKALRIQQLLNKIKENGN